MQYLQIIKVKKKIFRIFQLLEGVKKITYVPTSCLGTINKIALVP